MGFRSNNSFVQPGEPVAAGVVNRPVRVNANNIEYLKQLLDAAMLGEAIFAREQTVSPSVVDGTPVYYNANTSRFEPALAATSTDLLNQRLITAPSAQIWGVVYTKLQSNKADILLNGYASVDLSNVLEGDEAVRAGTYYLSTVTPGKLTLNKPAIAIAVLQSDGVGRVYVCPQRNDVLEQHTHLHFRLKALPAGTHVPPGVGDPHVITTPDVDLEGWLPASHTSFGGHAPAGAVFGYNLNASPALKAAWPPVPAESAVLLKDGVKQASGRDGLVIFDRYGIWWMSDCYGEVPFPDTISTTPETLSQWSDVSDGECYVYQMELDLYFTQFAFLTDQTVVTKLVTRDDRILITCQDGTQAASVGALELALNLSFSTGDNTSLSRFAFKTFEEATGKFTLGPVASGIYSKSSALVVTGESAYTATIDEVPRTVVFGAVGIDLDLGINREMPVQLIRLDGVKEEYIENVMYLGLPNGKLTSLRGRIHIPDTLDATTPKLKLKFRLLGLGTGAVPALTLTSRRVPKPSALNTPVALPTSDSARTLSLTATFTVAKQYIDVESDQFTVSAGEDVLFTLQRGSGDAYSHELGVMRLAGILIP